MCFRMGASVWWLWECGSGSVQRPEGSSTLIRTWLSSTSVSSAAVALGLVLKRQNSNSVCASGVMVLVVSGVLMLLVAVIGRG